MWFQFGPVLKSKGPICLVDSSLDISANVICGGASWKAAPPLRTGALAQRRGTRAFAGSPPPPLLLMSGALLRKLPGFADKWSKVSAVPCHHPLCSAGPARRPRGCRPPFSAGCLHCASRPQRPEHRPDVRRHAGAVGAERTHGPRPPRPRLHPGNEHPPGPACPLSCWGDPHLLNCHL